MERDSYIYCPQCSSHDVDIVCLNPPEPDKISIDELPLPMTYFSITILKFYQYKATCNNCGYSREYTGTGSVAFGGAVSD